MSALAFAGASQFAALAVLQAGGGALTAIVAGTLVNLRFLPMGIAIGPSLRHGPFGRAIRSLAIIDTSWVLSRRGSRSYDVDLMIGATAIQYLTWVAGTVTGVVLGPVLGDTQAWGLDAIFPAFMLALLAGELTRPGAKTVALLGAAIALALTPFAPAGIPIVAASAAALLERGP
jgi:predicted branched-subunit amino acid permease